MIKNNPWQCRWIERVGLEGGGWWDPLNYSMLLGSLAVASRSFVKDLPGLVTQVDFKNAFTFDDFYFLPLTSFGSERLCSTQPPLMQ